MSKKTINTALNLNSFILGNPGDVQPSPDISLMNISSQKINTPDLLQFVSRVYPNRGITFAWMSFFMLCKDFPKSLCWWTHCCNHSDAFIWFVFEHSFLGIHGVPRPRHPPKQSQDLYCHANTHEHAGLLKFINNPLFWTIYKGGFIKHRMHHVSCSHRTSIK